MLAEMVLIIYFGTIIIEQFEKVYIFKLFYYISGLDK